MTDTRQAVAEKLRERFHEHGDEVPRPWAEIGDDQKGWLDLADEVLALAAPASGTGSEDTARIGEIFSDLKGCTMQGRAQILVAELAELLGNASQ